MQRRPRITTYGAPKPAAPLSSGCFATVRKAGADAVPLELQTPAGNIVLTDWWKVIIKTPRDAKAIKGFVLGRDTAIEEARQTVDYWRGRGYVMALNLPEGLSQRRV